jgi:type IV pilus assembly protein PilA
MTSYLRKRVTGDERGFTLIELLVVVIILGILTAIAVPSYLSFRGRSNDAAAKANVRTIIPDIEQYNADNNGYVGMTMTGLQATYDASIDPSKYTLKSVTATSYCVDSSSGTSTWNKAGPNAQIVSGACP